MAISFETRVPFLDHVDVKLAWRLPLNMKLLGYISKWPLRKVLYKSLPKEMIERFKVGFAIPVLHWLRGPLLDWVEKLLPYKLLDLEGCSKPEIVRQLWGRHLNGLQDLRAWLWPILVFRAWLKEQA